MDIIETIETIGTPTDASPSSLQQSPPKLFLHGEGPASNEDIDRHLLLTDDIKTARAARSASLDLFTRILAQDTLPLDMRMRAATMILQQTGHRIRVHVPPGGKMPPPPRMRAAKPNPKKRARMARSKTLGKPKKKQA